MQVNRLTLKNGLRLVHHFSSRTGNVTINLLYGVGSRNEEGQKTGLAHLLEHMMFCGSKNIPNFDAPLEKIGGTSNAFTSCDVTNYYLTLPKENVETGFWLESDRMLNPNLSAKSCKVQKQIVLEEFKQGLNEPYGEVSQLLKSLSYKVHPYSHDTIGLNLAQVEALGVADVRDFFKKHYRPANAVLAVVGNIEWETVTALAQKWFGDIPKRRNPKLPQPPAEPKQTGPRELTRFSNPPQNSIYKAFHMCSCTHPDYFACDMLSDILANGKSARLPQALIYGKKLFTAIDAFVGSNIDPGLFTIVGRLSDGADPNEASAAIDEQLQLLVKEKVSEIELDKWKNKYQMNALAARFDFEQVASDLAFFEYIGRPEFINTMVDEYCKTTPEQLQKTAAKLFRHTNSNTLYFLKK